MKNIKKFSSSILLSLALTVSISATSLASYDDIGNHWASSVINTWSDNGVIKGSDNKFHPRRDISRSEVATILDTVMKYQKKSSNNFIDLRDKWYTDAILKSNAAGVLKGDGLKVRPEDKITRQEAAVVFSKAFNLVNKQGDSTGFQDESEISSWAKEYVSVMKNQGYMIGSEGKFRPKDNITRAEIVQILDNIIKGYYNKPGTYQSNVDGAVIINSSDVELKDVNINGSVIITEGVTSGKVHLNNVNVTGSVVIRSSNTNVSINSSKIKDISISGQDTSIYTDKQTKVDTINTSNIAKDTLINSERVPMGNVSPGSNYIKNEIEEDKKDPIKPDKPKDEVDKKEPEKDKKPNPDKEKEDEIIKEIENIRATIVGSTRVTAEDINRNGFKIEVSITDGKFAENLTKQQKDSIINGLEFDLDEGMIGDGFRGNIDRLRKINDTNHSYVVLAAKGEDGNTINTIDRFLSFDKTIPNELKKNGTVEVNSRGNLVISSNSSYFKNFSNIISYTSGGVEVGWGDLPIYVNIPKDVIKGAKSNIRTDDFYGILEMRASVEIRAYNDEQAYKAKDEERTHVVSSLTEEDIRKGGKLIRVSMDSRNGPNRWSVDRKLNPLFIKHSFRTDERFSASGSDHPEWAKVEEALGASLPANDPKLYLWNNYWLTPIEEKGVREQNTYSPSKMWYTIELPVIADFDIDRDLEVYVNLLMGMTGGSGQSGEEGYPYWGQDGRLSFIIDPTNDDDLKADVKVEKDSLNSTESDINKEELELIKDE